MKKALSIILFLILIICTIITLHLTSPSGVVMDEFNLGATQYYGGANGLHLHWLRIALLLIGSLAALFNLVDD